VFDLPLAGVVSALPALIAWSYHHSNCPLLAVEHLRLLLLRHGTLCRKTQQRHYNVAYFSYDLKLICFANLILALFFNLTFYIYPHSGFEVAVLLRPLTEIMID